MSGYYANGHALSYQSPPGIITGGPLSSASTINSISKKVEIDGRSYTVAIEIKEIGSSLSKGFSIPQNTSYYPGIYLLFGTDITFDIYILNDKGQKAGKITYIEFTPISTWASDQMNSLSLVSVGGSFSTYPKENPTCKRWSGQSEVVQFKTGSSTVVQGWVLELSKLRVRFEPIVTNPYPPVVEFP